MYTCVHPNVLDDNMLIQGASPHVTPVIVQCID